MPKVPIRMTVLIMAVHDCPLGRLLGKGVRKELNGRELAAAYMTEFKEA